MKVESLSRAALIAAVYTAITYFLAPISYGPVQLRVSEALTVFPYFEPAAIPGLFVGVVIANALGSPFGIIDIVGGSLITLVAAYLTWRIRNKSLALLPPVLLNAFGVALIIKLAAKFPVAYLATVGWIALGQAIAVYGLGYPLLVLVLRRRLFVREEVFVSKMRERR